MWCVLVTLLTDSWDMGQNRSHTFNCICDWKWKYFQLKMLSWINIKRYLTQLSSSIKLSHYYIKFITPIIPITFLITCKTVCPQKRLLTVFETLMLIFPLSQPWYVNTLFRFLSKLFEMFRSFQCLVGGSILSSINRKINGYYMNSMCFLKEMTNVSIPSDVTTVRISVWWWWWPSITLTFNVKSLCLCFFCYF